MSVNALFGRELLLDDLNARLHDGALLALVGAGGMGKTSVARGLLQRRPGHFVDLSPCTAPVDVFEAVAHVVEVPVPSGKAPARRLAAVLAERGQWVVLDNAEHVLDGVLALVDALAAEDGAPPVLLTSRVVPEHAAVRTVFIKPLSEQAGRELFLAHADPVIVDAERDQGAIGSLVARLGGSPLALHLAAGRTVLQGVPDLVRSVEEGASLSDILGRQPDRHGSLDAVVEASWDLLSEPQRQALSRLTLASTPLPLRDVTGWGVPADQILGLVRASLVQREVHAGGAVRLRVLDEVRRWVQHHHPAPASARLDHAAWFAERASTLLEGYYKPGAQAVRAEVVSILPEVRTALTLAQDLPVEVLTDLAHAASLHAGHADIARCATLHAAWSDWLPRLPWLARAQVVNRLVGSIRRDGRPDEALSVVEQHLEQARHDPAPQRALLHLRVCRANVRVYTSQVSEAHQELLDLVPQAESVDDAELLSRVLRCLGTTSRLLGHADQAREHHQRAAELARQHGLLVHECVALSQLIIDAQDLTRAEHHGRQVLAICDTLGGDVRIEAMALGSLLSTQLLLGGGDRARATWERLSALLSRAGDREMGSYYGAAFAAAQAIEVPREQAHTALDQALARVREQAVPRGEGRVHLARGVLHHLDGELDAAERAYEEGEAVATRLGLRQSMAASQDLIAILHAQRDDQVRPTTDPVAAALVASWTGGALAEVEACLQAHPPRSTFQRWFHALARQARPRVQPWVIAPDGTSLGPPRGDVIDLSRRGPLRRVLSALAHARVQHPGQAVDPQALVEAGWPGQRILPDAARTRLYGVIRELRRHGLTDVLQTVAEGYRLDPEVAVRVEETAG